MKNLLPDIERQYIRDNLARMKLATLKDYTNSVIWLAKRQAYYLRHKENYQCRKCRVRHNLKLHHKTYKRLGAELDEDLEYLCGECHTKEHRNWTRRVMRAKTKKPPFGSFIRLLPP